MKKIFVFLAFAVWVLSGCKKENDRAFEQTPEERVLATLNSFQKQLQEAQFGWKAVLRTDSGKGAAYGFYFRFNDENRVEMFSDFSGETATVPKESSYRLKALQQVSLLFDTYSYIHLLADPDPDVAGGELGAGFGVDFEFFMDKELSSTDSIKLVGRKKGSEGWLVRATQAEMNAYYGGDLGDAIAFENINSYANYFKRVTIDGVEYDVKVNGRTITLTWLEGGVEKTFTTGYYYTVNGLVFTTPFTNGATSFQGLGEITWDPVAPLLTFRPTGSSNTVSVVGTGRPLLPDPTAWARFRQMAIDEDTYWATVEGFRINGVTDAYNIQNLTSLGLPYYYTIFFPGYTTTYDLFAPLFLNTATNSVALHYGAAFNRTATVAADGRARWNLLGTLGTFPTSGPFYNTTILSASAGGYYFVQTGENTFDMVSASDGKAWISWELVL